MRTLTTIRQTAMCLSGRHGLRAALLGATLLAATPATAQLVQDWDTDNNGYLTEQEFVEGSMEMGLFNTMDRNDDGRITEREMANGLFTAWDVNDNDVLSIGEWDDGFDSYFGEATVNMQVSNWDQDGDDNITRREFRQGLQQTQIFAAIEGNADDDSVIAMAETDTGATNRQTAQGGMAQGGMAQRGMDVEQESAPVTGTVDLVTWDYENLRGGWSADTLMDADVYGRDGEEFGEVEDIILNPDNSIRAIVVEAGGFLDIGDTHLAVPWERVEIGGNLEELIVPVDADNYEQYSLLGEFGFGLTGDEVAMADGARQIYRVSDDAETRGGTWRASNLLGDYVALQDEVAYGVVDDLIFDRQGTLTAVVVEPDINTGYAAGPYAYPFYGYEFGFDPALDYYGLPYGYDEVGTLDPFDYGYL